MLILPYAGEEGNTVVKKMKLDLQHLLPPNVKTKVIFTGRRLKTKFKIKDEIPKDNNNNIVYKYECGENSCKETYIGECSRRLAEKIKDHQGRDMNSHVFIHSVEWPHSSYHQ